MFPQVPCGVAPLLGGSENPQLQSYRHWSKGYTFMQDTTTHYKRAFSTDVTDTETPTARNTTETERDEKKARMLMSTKNTSNVTSPIPLDHNDTLHFFVNSTMQHFSELRRCNSENLCSYYKACKELEALKSEQETLNHKMNRIDEIICSSLDTIKSNLNSLAFESNTLETRQHSNSVQASHVDMAKSHGYHPTAQGLAVGVATVDYPNNARVNGNGNGNGNGKGNGKDSDSIATEMTKAIKHETREKYNGNQTFIFAVPAALPPR
jgi:hypothetical protein